MRLVTLYRHGLTMGTPNMKGNKSPAKRGQVDGWSKSATRRNLAFLRSADEELLNVTSDGELLFSVSITLTIKDCPASSDDWHKLRRAFIKRLERMGLYRSHWVTEWQRRGVPHLHGAFWFPMPVNESTEEITRTCIDHWLSLTSDKYGAGPSGQHYHIIYDTIGWFKYLAKHATRGIMHYQRSPENVPAGWKKTGRVWGHTGDWPLSDPDKVLLNDSEFFRYRRIVRSWRISDARASRLPYRIKTARVMLKDNDKERSKLRGVSEWIPEHLARAMLDITKSI